MTDVNARRWRLGQKEFLRAILGNVMLLLILLGVERVFFGQGYYSSLIQHPFWIVVLVASVQDGLYVGVLVAAAATALMDWPARPAEADITTHYIQVAVMPLQWLLAALCIGLFREAELKKTRATMAEMEQQKRVSDVLAADIVELEAQIAREHLEKLSADTSAGSENNIVTCVLELQDLAPENLHDKFKELARLCTPLPAYFLTTNAEGGLELDDGEKTVSNPNLELKFDHELLLTLRNSAVVILDRTEPFEDNPKFEFVVLVGIASPDRRSLHGAVALLAPKRTIANDSVDAAKFLAAVLGPILTRARAPKIAALKGVQSGVVRSIHRG